MDNHLINQIMDHIVCVLNATGHDPRFQLLLFLKTDDCTYITRHDNVRKLIQQLDKDAVSRYVKDNFATADATGKKKVTSTFFFIFYRVY